MTTLTHLFIDIVNQEASIYYGPDTVLGIGGSNRTKLGIGSVLQNLQSNRQICIHYIVTQIGVKL